jgi:uncharacterized protein (DUF427 family)
MKTRQLSHGNDWPLALALKGVKTVGREARMIRPDGSHYDISISAVGTYRVLEAASAPTFYIPPNDVRLEFLKIAYTDGR